MTKTLTHLKRLEAESIQIMREVAAEAENPVMLYSIGKDSSVMLTGRLVQFLKRELLRHFAIAVDEISVNGSSTTLRSLR